MDRIIIKCCRECNLQKICKEKYPGKFPPCRDEAVANFSTSTNKRSRKLPLLEELGNYLKRYKKSCYCDYDNEVGAASFIGFIARHHPAGA